MMNHSQAACGICGGPADYVRQHEAWCLICPRCGATHPGRAAQVTERPVPLSGVVPLHTPEPAPQRVFAPPTPTGPVTAHPRAAERLTGSLPPVEPTARTPRSPAPRQRQSPPRRMVFDTDLAMGVILAAGFIATVGYIAYQSTLPLGASDSADAWGANPLVAWSAAPLTELGTEPPPGTAEERPAAAPVRRPEGSEQRVVLPNYDAVPELVDVMDPSPVALVAGQLPGAAQEASGRAEADVEDIAPIDQEPLAVDRKVLRLHTVPPGADVSVDGRPRGRTPAKLMLNPGQYRIDLALGPARTTVDVAATANRRLCFQLAGSELVEIDCAGVVSSR